ncbi:MAG: thiamine phosphate synthase [Planctomycetales bacterium]|nr:thiamine phosphate synthase [Planctomycetales bacterium]
MQPLPPADRIAALRIVDANFNRAMEALRVLEEYCRFGLDDGHLTKCWKEVRHGLAQIQASIPSQDLLCSRNTAADVGTSVKTEQELSRKSIRHVAQASCKRLEQAMRSLEEYAKVLTLPSPEIEALRYQIYTLEKATLLTADSQQKLADGRLYVLLDGGESTEAFEKRAREICQAGPHIVQLRDKKLADRELLERAHVLRRITRDCGTLFIMNDRPDLAVLSAADGVHVGQEELTIQDVRRIVGPEMLVGLSTHTIEQARQAVLAGANYIGCGPTFPSGTKHFDSFPGLPFLRDVGAEISLPAFAIGGITPENILDVLATGMKRIAVGGAVTNSKSPVTVLRGLAANLTAN